MGQSTDGILAYGVALWDEGEEPWAGHYDEETDTEIEEDEDSEEGWLLKQCPGLPPEPPEPADWKAKAAPDVVAWHDYWKVKRQALADLGVSVENYCHSDNGMYALVVSASVKRCSRGYPEAVDLREMDAATDDYRQTLMAFCERAGVGLKDREPQWLLMSYWG